jgi:hypothetical protein
MSLPPFDDPEDEVPHYNTPEFQTLMREAQRYGFHYSGQDISELNALVTLAKIECGDSHPVPCFGLNYESTDRRCRICQLQEACAAKDRRPRIEILDPNTLGDVICNACGSGELRVELRIPDSSIVRDYGCSTPGCLNTLGIQTGWDETRVKLTPEIFFAPPTKHRIPGIVAPPVVEAKATPRVKIKVKVPKKPAVPTKKPVSAKKAGPPKLRVVEKPVVSEEKPALAMVKPPVTLRYKFNLKEYRSLNSIATHITGSRAWNAKKFFSVDPETLKPGQILTRNWKGELFTVEVIEAK